MINLRQYIITPLSLCAGMLCLLLCADISTAQIGNTDSPPQAPQIAKNRQIDDPPQIVSNGQNSPAPADCKLSIISSLGPIDNARLLTPVAFNYKASYSANCQLKVLDVPHDALICDKPLVKTQQGEDSSRLVSTIEISCQYRQPGVFYSIPMMLEASAKSGTGLARKTPPPRKVQVKAFDDSYSAELSHKNMLALYPWHGSLFRELVMLIGIIFAVALLCIVIYHFSRPVKHQDALPEPQKLRPIECFLNDLTPLVDMNPVTIDEYKLFYDVLSNALRVFIKDLFDIDAMSMTTRQIYEALHHLDMPEYMRQDVLKILGDSDIVKYTRECPTQTANMMLLRDAQELAQALNDFNDIYQKKIHSQNNLNASVNEHHMDIGISGNLSVNDNSASDGGSEVNDSSDSDEFDTSLTGQDDDISDSQKSAQEQG